MTEERRPLSKAMPPEAAISSRYSMRQESTPKKSFRQQEEHHNCKCGGIGNCPDCPNKIDNKEG